MDRTLDGYRLLRLIGVGGFGEVWLCESVVIPGQWKALKWIPALNLRRLQRERSAIIEYKRAVQGRALGHLMQIEHVNLTEDGLFYIMPLADGQDGNDPADPSWEPATMASLIARQKNAPDWFDSNRIIELMASVLKSLQSLADMGLVHRDLKPENILFFNGCAVVADMSLVGSDMEGQTRRGTPGYVAPSWYVESGGNPDQYAAGATLFALMTGNQPDKMGRVGFRWPPGGESSLSSAERKVWLKLHGVVYRATHETHSERFRDFEAMRLCLESGLGDAESLTKPKARALWIVAVVALAGLVWWVADRHVGRAGPPTSALSEESLSSADLFEKAMAAYTGGGQAVDLIDMDLASRLFAKAAEQGDPRALNMVGFFHLCRIEPFNPERAFPWFEKSAAKGDPAGQFNIACCYHWGIGTSRDDRLAMHWFRRSASANFPPALATLGVLLYTDTSSDVNHAEAIKLLLRASHLGRPEAMHVMANALEAGDGIAADNRQAQQWRQQSIKLRYAAISSHVAVWVDALGVTSWRGANFVMLERQSTSVSSDQLHEFEAVGVTLLEGASGPSFEIPPNHPELDPKRIIKAIEQNRLAALQRNSEAELWLGKALLEGRFLEKSKKQALAWLRRAAEQGREGAQQLLIQALSSRADGSQQSKSGLENHARRE